VDGRVELRYRRLSPEEREEILDQIIGGDFSNIASVPPFLLSTHPVVEEPGEVPKEGLLASLYARLMRIEEKLDALLSLLNNRYGNDSSMCSTPPSEEVSETCVVNISGGGMRFPTQDPLKVGDYLDVILTLPILPDHPIRLLGQVVHVRPLKDTLYHEMHSPLYGVAIRFDALLEEDRERIIRYTFFQQSKAIRKSKGEPLP